MVQKLISTKMVISLILALTTMVILEENTTNLMRKESLSKLKSMKKKPKFNTDKDQLLDSYANPKELRKVEKASDQYLSKY